MSLMHDGPDGQHAEGAACRTALPGVWHRSHTNSAGCNRLTYNMAHMALAKKRQKLQKAYTYR
jgi:hypothetical protein